MGAKVNCALKCPGCELDTKVVFRRPGAVGAEVFEFECSACKSAVLVRAKRPKGPDDGRCEFSLKVTRPSNVLLMLLADARAHAEKPVDQIDQEAGAPVE